MSTTADPTTIADIARRHFWVNTLETRNRDSLDFHNVAVWAIKAALDEAYEAGRCHDAG